MALRGSNSSSRRPVVVAVRFSAMGDVLIAVPVICALCREYPDTRFVFVTRTGYSRLFLDPPANLTVVEWNLRKEARSVAGVVRLAMRLFAKYRPTAFADLHDVIRSRAVGLVAALRHVPSAVIRKDRRLKKQLVSKGAEAFGHPLLTTVERYARVFTRLGYNLSGDILSTAPRAFQPGAVPAIGVAPFAAHPGKIYPPELMEKVVDCLIARGYWIFLFGAPGSEQQVLDSWAAKDPALVVSMPSLNLGLDGELKFMRSLNLMVAMDSGNMHMASLAGVPVVSVWGATHPYAGFAAPTAREELRVQADLPCRPCSVFGNRPCRQPDDPYGCLTRITPDMIIQKIDLALSGRN